MKPPPDKQLILDSLAAMASESGRTPSRSKFLSRSGLSEHQVLQFFPTWSDAVRAAGLFPHTMNRRLEDRELFQDWVFAVRTKGKYLPVAPTGTSANTTLAPSNAGSVPGQNFPRFFAILPRADRNGPMSWRSCLPPHQNLPPSPIAVGL